MIIEDSFLNLAWIGIHKIEKKVLLEILDLKIDKRIQWEEAYDLINNSFDEKILLSFKIEDWEFLIGKYFFLDKDSIKEIMNELSLKSKEVNSFAIDVWSNFYCYSRSMNGINIRYWKENDEGIISEGNRSKVENEIIEKETANKILALANRTTISFEKMEKFLITKEVEILK